MIKPNSLHQSIIRRPVLLPHEPQPLVRSPGFSRRGFRPTGSAGTPQTRPPEGGTPYNAIYGEGKGGSRYPVVSTSSRLHCFRAVLLALWIASLLTSMAQQNPSAVEKEIEALKTRLAELERIVKSQKEQPSTAASQPSAAAATPDKSTQTAAPDKPAESGFVRWNELTVGKSRFKLYGFLRLDSIYDDSRPNNTQIPGYIRSEDPTAPAGIRSAPDDDGLTIPPRLTRFSSSEKNESCCLPTVASRPSRTIQSVRRQSRSKSCASSPRFAIKCASWPLGGRHRVRLSTSPKALSPLPRAVAAWPD